MIRSRICTGLKTQWPSRDKSWSKLAWVTLIKVRAKTSLKGFVPVLAKNNAMRLSIWIWKGDMMDRCHPTRFCVIVACWDPCRSHFRVYWYNKIVEPPPPPLFCFFSWWDDCDGCWGFDSTLEKVLAWSLTPPEDLYARIYMGGG